MPNTFKRSFTQYNADLAKEQTELSGELGVYLNGEKLVEVANRSGFVYVRLRNNLNEVIQAFNDQVSLVFDLPVILIREGTRYKVKGRDTARYSDWGTSSSFLPNHGSTHEFNPDGGGGGDIVFMYGRQIIPLLLSPSGSAGGSNLLVADNYVYHKPDGSWIRFGVTGTQDLLPTYRPATTGAWLALMYANTNTGNVDFIVNTGSSFMNTITGTYETLQYLPSLNDNTLLPLMAVRLTSGTNSIQWGNLYDVRQYYTPFSSGSGGGGGFDGYGVVVQKDGIYKVSGTALNFVNSNIYVNVSGTIAEIIVSGSQGGGAVTSVFGRTGDVTGAYGDYPASQITYPAGSPSGLTGTNVYEAIYQTFYNSIQKPDFWTLASPPTILKSDIVGSIEPLALTGDTFPGYISGTPIIQAIPKASSSDISVGTGTAMRGWSPKDIVDAINAHGAGGSSAVHNAIINGECLVAQAWDVTLSTSAQFGKLDRFAAWGSGTAVGAGTITQNTSSSLASGYSLKLSGVTITGTGIVYVRHRIEAKDAAHFINQSASFAVKVLHDVGSAKTYTITIRKANAADDFSATTEIGNNGGTSVSSGTNTTISYENVSMGACGNGIEIEVKCECGAVTTKNFEYAEFILDIGSTAPSFAYKSYSDILGACLRYRMVPTQIAEPIIWPAYAARVSTNLIDALMLFPVPMFTTPTLKQAAGITWGTSYPLGSGKIGFYNNVTSAYATSSGLLTLSFANGNNTGGVFRATATSFNGSSGNLGNMYLGTNLHIYFDAEP